MGGCLPVQDRQHRGHGPAAHPVHGLDGLGRRVRGAAMTPTEAARVVARLNARSAARVRAWWVDVMRERWGAAS